MGLSMKDYLQKATHTDEENITNIKTTEKRKLRAVIKKFEMTYPPDENGLYPISISRSYAWTPEEIIAYNEAKTNYKKYLI
jgi:hypothetical protein